VDAMHHLKVAVDEGYDCNAYHYSTIFLSLLTRPPGT
jgi:hypothetical protein